MKIFIGIIFLLLLLGTVNAQTAEPLSNEANAEVSILFPVERTYSLSPEGPWQVEPISFYYDGDPGTLRKPTKKIIYIKTENHAPVHFDMNVYHEFSCDCMDLFGYSYIPLVGNHLTYGIQKDNGKWDTSNMGCLRQWPRVERNKTTTVIRYYKQTYVNDIEPNTIRIERVVYKFRWFWDQPGTYTYDSHIELVGSQFK